MYTRTPAGGPLAGGTRVEIRGEGLNGYGAVIDKINNELIDTNMAERDEKSVWYYRVWRVWPELGLGPWPGKGVGMSEHSSKSAVLLSLKRNVRCRFGDDGSPLEIDAMPDFRDLCRRQEGCLENATFWCVAPPNSAGGRTLSVAANQMHFVPVLPRGTYTYHARPSVTQLEPPGGPVVGGTLVTLHGSGFDALGAEGNPLCKFDDGTKVDTLRYLSTGTSIVCRTGKNNRAQRKRLTVSLNTQDYEPVAWLRYYERPTVSAIAPTGGPTRPGYQLQVVGSGLDGMLAAMNTADEYGVTGLFKPLCRFGAMIGAVTKVGSDGESLECDVPTNGSAGAYQTAFALNGLDFDVGVDERFDAPHRYLYFHQKLLLVTPGGGPVGGGTVVRVEGEGFDGFDNLAATAKCRFVRDGAACAATSSARCDDGAAALGKVRVILSGNALECEAPDVGVVSDTHIQVSLNGVHFVGADTEDASWLLYQYYHQPRLLGLDPAGGPTAGSGAAGMSQTSWVVTLHGRGFTRLSNRPEVRCAFGPPEGGAPTAAAVVYSATFVTCLLPPHPPADVLMALTLNGQDYVHQRVEEWYDISNKSETGPEHDDLRQRMEAKEWPLPGNLSRLTTAVPPPPDLHLTSNGSTLIRHYSGTYFHFRYYSQTLDTLVPRGGPATRAGAAGNFTVTLYGNGFHGMRDGGDGARCRFGAASVPVLHLSKAGDVALCTAPAVDLGGRASAAIEVSLALNEQHYVSSTPPSTYLFYAQTLASLAPSGGPVGGATVVTVRGLGFDALRDGGAAVRCKFGDLVTRVARIPTLRPTRRPARRGGALRRAAGVGGGRAPSRSRSTPTTTWAPPRCRRLLLRRPARVWRAADGRAPPRRHAGHRARPWLQRPPRRRVDRPVQVWRVARLGARRVHLGRRRGAAVCHDARRL